MQEEAIDTIVDELAKVLNDPSRMFDKQNIVRYEDEPFFGWELLLCNISEIKGKPIEKGAIYMMPCPVLNIRDHRSGMRVAFFAGGRKAVMKYLEKWVKPEQMDLCRSIVMGNYLVRQKQLLEDAGVDQSLIERVA